jgi:hypothetical protein
MNNAEHLLGEALRCVRLGQTISDPDVRETLRSMALDFMDKANRAVEAECPRR